MRTSVKPVIVKDLEKEANSEAVNRVSMLFQSSESLSRLEHYRQQFSQEKSAIDRKLRALIQSQLNEINFSLNLLQENVESISGVREKFEEVVEQCKECRKLLNEKDYPSIRAIRTARKNIEHTINLLKVFRDIPKTAEDLSEKIRSEGISMKDAYFELRNLYMIRDKAYAHGNEYSSKMSRLFEVQFVKVKEVASTLEKKIFDNISECVDLAGDDPSVVVSTLMVIEMEDRSVKSKIFSSKRPMKERAIETLEQSIADYFGLLFENSVPKGMEEKTDDPDVVLQTLLKVGRRLINELDFLHQYLIPCFPPRYNISAFFESRYTKWLYSRLLLLSSDLSTFSSAGLLDAILWIEDYISILQCEEANENANGLLEYSKTILAAYISREREKNSEWFSSIVRNDWVKDWSDNYVVANNCSMTSSPADLFSMLNLQVQVAEGRLNGQNFFEFLKMCCESLLEMQDLQSKILSSRGIDKDEEFLCAMINNGNFCKENTLDLQEHCSEHLLTCETLEASQIEDLDMELEDIFDKIVDGFVAFSTNAAEVLVVKIIELIDTELLSHFFTNEWLSDKQNSLTNNITATFEDYFTEFKGSLADPFYFAKIMQHCLSVLIKSYIHRFYSSKPDLSNPSIFSKMEEDLSIIQRYFLNPEYSEYISEKYITEQIQVLDKLKSLASADEEWIPLYFDTIHDLFMDQGAKHLSLILNLRHSMSSKAKNAILAEYRQKFPFDSSQEQGNGQDSVTSGIRSIGRQTRKNNKKSTGGLMSAFWNGSSN